MTLIPFLKSSVIPLARIILRCRWSSSHDEDGEVDGSDIDSQDEVDVDLSMYGQHLPNHTSLLSYL